MTNRARNYFFYIMASRSRTLYCGVTSNLLNRVWEHKTKQFEGFTAKYKIERLVLFERYDDIRNAIAREKQVKRWRREKKLWLIERQNPTWLDLSEGWYDSFENAGPSTSLASARSARDDGSGGAKAGPSTRAEALAPDDGSGGAKAGPSTRAKALARDDG